MTIWLLCSLAFFFGWIMRGLLSLSDAREIATLEGRIQYLEEAAWVKRQGVLR